MLKVGLTGGLACGKSFVARELARLGCHIIHADALGHEMLAPDGESYERVVSLFGSDILNGDAHIDRARLAALVFDNPDRLAALNAIVHPAVRQRENEIVTELARSDPEGIAVIEAAILIETGIYRDFDCLIVVLCDEARQLERALVRDPTATSASVLARLRRQMPAEEKSRYADYIIDTSGTESDTIRQTEKVYTELRALPQGSNRVLGQ